MAILNPLPPPPPPGPPPAAATRICPHGNTRSSASASEQPAPAQPPPQKTKTQDLKAADSLHKGKGLAHADESGPRLASFKDALLRPRTFRPRFPVSSNHGEQPWLEHRPRRPTASARSGHGQKASGGFWSQQLRVNADTKCFNCLSDGHRISACRDPTRCLLCWHFGHKARFCPNPKRPPPACHSSHPSAVDSHRRIHRTAAAPHRQIHHTAAASAPTPAPTTTSCQIRKATGGSTAATTTIAPTASTAATGAEVPPKTMNYASWSPCAPGERPFHIRVGVPRSEATRTEERNLEVFGLLAVQLDGRVRLDSTQVKLAACRQLRVPPSDLGVSRLAAASFLFRFEEQMQRNAALQRGGGLMVGHVGLRLLPWRRQIGANDTLSKFNYKIWLCIEGVPGHLRHPEALASLLKPPAFFEDFGCAMEKPEEEECVRTWVWTSDPNEIVISVTMHAEEPIAIPVEGFADQSPDLDMPQGLVRVGPALTLDYDVLIHVDRVLDYSPLPSSPSHCSMHSNTSGLQDEEPEEEWPARFTYSWKLGVPDGGRRAQMARRTSVHDRLGDHGRDRSPPRGGPGGGLGLQQMPPAGRHNTWRAGGSSRPARGGHIRDTEIHFRGASGSQWKWQVKKQLTQHSEPFSELFLRDMCREQAGARGFDPMLLEAGASPVSCSILSPMVPQRSVEPTAPDGVIESCRHDEGAFRVDQIHLMHGQEGLSDAPQEGRSDAPQSVDVLQQVEDVAAGNGMTQQVAGQLDTELDQRVSEVVSDTIVQVPIADENGLGLGPWFDLNKEGDEFVPMDQDSEVPDRVVLGNAEGRMNKDSRDQVSRKGGTKSGTKFTVPLRKALLCNPSPKPRTVNAKKTASSAASFNGPSDMKTSSKATKRPTCSIDDQATALLLRTCEKSGDDGKQQLGEHFVDPLEKGLVTDIREVFGIQNGGSADPLCALACAAGVDDE